MANEQQERISFEVETARILEILSKEIYDSPNALLRENVQNAYDAVLMRCELEGLDLADGSINIQIEGNRLIITDDGIGMSEETLRNSFWRAGSSGKQTNLARKSGVVGTFGIGAMANFGVATRLQVETRYVGSDQILVSYAERESLSISEECIVLQRLEGEGPPGTTVIADLEPDQTLNVEKAREYLEPFVRYLPVGVSLNGQAISKREFSDAFGGQLVGFEAVSNRQVSNGLYAATLETLVSQSGTVAARLFEITLADQPVRGELLLIQGSGQLMGYRNFFGLAPIPVGGYYQFGGFANLSLLHPTAGREALTRESIEHVSNLVTLVEAQVTHDIAPHDAADRNNSFLSYLLAHGKTNLAENVTIKVLPDENNVRLGQLVEYSAQKELLYYRGSDQSILQTFASQQTNLAQVSQSNPRGKLQLRYLTGELGVSEVPDSATVLEEYFPEQLRIEEAALQIRLLSVLEEDYLLGNVEIAFARISHGVEFLVRQENGAVKIHISRDSSALKPVLECYFAAYEVFEGFVKDFARNYLYDRISDFVPSSTREGADALRNILRRNRELYRYEESEFGELEPLLADYLAGDISLGEVLKTSKRRARPQTQRVSADQIGTVEEELPDVVQSTPAAEPPNAYGAAPPILRPEVKTSMKILTVGQKYAQLSGFQLFLGLSDRLFKREGDFFRWPHTTKAIWGGHRVIYIFGLEQAGLSLYYDIELKESLPHETAGGDMFPTTTLFMQNRIFIPVPSQLEDVFRVVKGAKEFFVRFDTIST